MCFSATASFVGAGVIGAAGIATLAMVRRPRDIPFAALPLIFAAHQALEGITWLQLGGSASEQCLTGFGVHAWVVIAWAFLPLYVPWAVWLMEPQRVRRWILLGISIVGTILFGFMIVAALQPEIGVQVVGNNLDYNLPFYGIWVVFPYVLATCFGPMVSSYVYAIIMGVTNFFAMLAAAIMREADFSSMWCTFAAFLSLIIFAHFLHERLTGSRLQVGTGRSLEHGGAVGAGSG